MIHLREFIILNLAIKPYFANKENTGVLDR